MALGQVATHRDTVDQQRSVAKLVLRVPDLHQAPIMRAHVQQRPQRLGRDPETESRSANGCAPPNARPAAPRTVRRG